MNRLRYLTAGESHGKALTGILEGLPAGLEVDTDYINYELKRRQQGYGRGGRMKIESDEIEILSGVRFGKTLGTPVSVKIENKDWKNWQKRMSVEKLPDTDLPEEITIPRPGHADLAGAVKYGFSDIRNVIERSSARETAIRTALAGFTRLFLRRFGIVIGSHVVEIHKVKSSHELNTNELETESRNADGSPVRCLDKDAEEQMISAIDTAKENGDTVGGRIEIAAAGLPVGLGSYTHWDNKLDGRIASAMMSIPAIKAVEIGAGIDSGRKFGSELHDPIVVNDSNGISRTSNNAGGIEAGITNGQPVIVIITMKPISTLVSALDSVDLKTKEAVKARVERSDVCAVPAASVVAEAMLALVLADAFLEKFYGDNIEDIKKIYNGRRRI
ncbi:MAG: chorismate synthase [bacterium]|nr:chorismate synthase [bacterium]